MSKWEKIDLIREAVKTGRGRSIFATPKDSGYLTWDELQKLVSEMPWRPIPEWMIPIVEKWSKEQESEEGMARFAEIEATWRSYEKKQTNQEEMQETNSHDLT